MAVKTLRITQPEIHKKTWGQELWIHNDEEFCGKILEFDEGARFSLHYHIQKAEAWYVFKGKFTLIYVDTEFGVEHAKELGVGQSVYIPRGVPHQLIALEPSALFEASTFHRNEDSYRIRR